LLFNLPPSRSAGDKLKRKVIGMPESPAPARLFRMTIGDKSALRASLERVRLRADYLVSRANC